ncbi:cytochrome b [Myceligenerans crystallogenes]|uniref:Cytochrome bc1 complex cytochrome b subunit n=1 Tax=Myceligenerans crystallogenes TaxID=316335 RepID=A0ABN2N6S3_9MICO
MARGIRALRARIFPDNWAGLLGEITLANFVVCGLSGILLATLYDPSTEQVFYAGPYEPLHGIGMSRALESTLQISFEVQGGLLLRQVHNWSASLMIATLIVHILHIYFSGRFRAPARLRWLALFALLFVAMGAGMTGSILPDDMLSGSSLAVLDGILKAIPLIGLRMSDTLFQGQFPSGAIGTMYPLHLYALPTLMAVLFAAIAYLGLPDRPGRLAVLRGDVLEDAAGPGAAARPRPLRLIAARTGGTILITFAIVTGFSAAVSVNPVWSYGPADPGNAAAGAGAVWYLAFLDGAQRLVPPGWELVVADRTVVLALLAPITLVGVFFVAALAYPFLESRFARGRARRAPGGKPHHHPVRTSVGVAAIVFYGTLWAAAGSDVIALLFQLSNARVIQVLQLTLLLGPLLGFAVTWFLCAGLRRREAEIAEHGMPTGRIIRTPEGGYIEAHAPVQGAGALESAGGRRLDAGS